MRPCSAKAVSGYFVDESGENFVVQMQPSNFNPEIINLRRPWRLSAQYLVLISIGKQTKSITGSTSFLLYYFFIFSIFCFLFVFYFISVVVVGLQISKRILAYYSTESDKSSAKS